MIQARGRIICVASVAGYLAAPGWSPYACSKFATEALVGSLRQEMKWRGVKVIGVEPGFMKTPLVAGAAAECQRVFDAAPQDVQIAYGKPWLDAQLKKIDVASTKMAENPQLVVNALIEATLSKFPKDHYIVGMSGRAVQFMTLLPHWISDHIATGAANCMVVIVIDVGCTTAQPACI